MKNRKTSYKVYGAWEFDREVMALNEESRKGWQLIKGGCFHTKLEKDDTVEYRYQIDYNTNRKDRKRYIETFEEQGWTYINTTYNGWNYFRKAYDPSLQEEEYQIYSDQDSFADMLKRWIRLANIMTVFLCVMEGILLNELCKNFQANIFVDAILYLFFMVAVQAGAMIVRKKKRDKDYHNRFPILQSMLVVWVIAIVVLFLV